VSDVAGRQGTEGISGAGRTALGIAAARSAESKRPDRLFDDRYADAFLAAGMAADLLPRRPSAGSIAVWQSMGDYVAIRTRFFDDFLLAATADGCGQLVLLGAGLDMRGFRLRWPTEVRLFELDTPEVHSFKEAVIAGTDWLPSCERVAVRADLRADWPMVLRAAGFRPGEPTAWLAEGLLRYLGETGGGQLLARVTALSTSGSRLAVEQTGLAMLRSPAMLAALSELDRSAADEQQALWSAGHPEADREPWLAAHGWQTRSSEVAELARQYGRPVPPAFAAGSASSGPREFVTATRL
jgi:methyltransferase (TIGR00027 family)